MSARDRREAAATTTSRSDWELALGKALRDLRKERGFTLAAVAKNTGLSVSFLSQLERGLTSASLNSLAVLSEALGSSTAALLSGAQQPQPEAVSYLRSGEGPEVANPEGAGYVLVQGERSVNPLLLVGGSRKFEPDYFSHEGDEFIYVLSGRVQFELVGEGIFDLGAGDSLCYRGGIKHRWRQLGARPCRFLSVLADH